MTFREWCMDNNLYKNEYAISHLMMDGGSLRVSSDFIDKFNKKYIECINEGVKLYIVEQKTKTFNFFIDLDYKDTDIIDGEYIKEVCQYICDKVTSLVTKKI